MTFVREAPVPRLARLPIAVFVFLLAVAVALPVSAQPPRKSPTMAQFLSPGYPASLVSAKKADRLAWTVLDAGKRNVYTAAGPDYKPVRLTSFLDDNGIDTSDPAISDDGSVVIFVRGHSLNRAGYGANPTSHADGPERSVWAVRTAGGPAWELGAVTNPLLSPDGRWAVSLIRGEPPKLVLVPAGAGESRPLPLGGITSTNWMEWTPDGRHVLFNGREGGAGFRVFRKDVTSPAPPEALTPEGYAIPWGSQPVSPDGVRFFAVAPEGRVVFSPSQGGDTAPVPGVEAGEEPIQWIDGGKAILVRQPGEVPARIWRVAVATGQRTFFRELTPPDLSGGTSITDVRFTPDLRSYAFDYWSLLSDLYLVEGLR